MRAFIAIDLPEELKESIFKITLPDADLSRVKKENIHLTLKFLGEIEKGCLEKTIGSLKKIKFSPFSLETSDIGFFPNENNIRVVWLGIKDDSELVQLQAEIDSILQPLFPKEKNFISHITLARVKFIQNKKQFTEEIKKIIIPSIKFDIDGFKLKISTLTPNGPIYEDIAAIHL